MKELKWTVIVSVSLGAVGLVMKRILPGPEQAGTLTWSYFILLGMLVAFTYMVPYAMLVAYRAKYQVEIIEMDLKKTPFVELLAVKDFRELYQAYPVTEWSIKALKFYDRAQEWKDLYSIVGTDPELIQIHAEEIFDKFVIAGSLLEINIQHNLRETIAKLFITKSGDIVEENCPEDAFDDAIEEVFKLMSRDSYARFRRTKEYKSLGDQGVLTVKKDELHVVRGTNLTEAPRLSSLSGASGSNLGNNTSNLAFSSHGSGGFESAGTPTKQRSKVSGLSQSKLSN